MHARKTRIKKKNFVESADSMIVTMKAELEAMKKYLISLNIYTSEDLNSHLKGVL